MPSRVTCTIIMYVYFLDFCTQGYFVVVKCRRETFDFSVHGSVNRKNIRIYRVSQEECVRLREGVPYAKVYRHNPKHLCPKLKSYGDNGQRSLKL